MSAWCDTGSSQRKTSLFSVIPTAIWPQIPSPRRLGLTLTPPIASSRCPTLCRLPSGAVLSSDLERHRHLLKAAALPEQVEPSQSPRGAQPSVPLLSWFSHHRAKATWELHSTACLAHSAPACPPPGPPRRMGFSFGPDKETHQLLSAASS